MAWNNVAPGDWDDRAPAAEEAVSDTMHDHKDDQTCHHCGQPGHMARECPDAPEESGDHGTCFNCGQEGHIKANCTEPQTFTGECHFCKQTGHRAAECPDKPADKCFNCKDEGHLAKDCTANRVFDRSNVEDLDGDAAWEKVLEADQAHDLDDVRAALKVYCKAMPAATYDELETAFRHLDLSIHLIAKEKELEKTFTFVNLQGELEKTYEVGLHWSSAPKRASDKEGWPETPAANMERLKDAGVPMKRGIPKCNRCDELGHTAKACPEEATESVDRVVVKCVNCDEVGHRARDCPTPRPDRFACRNCKQSGHQASECTEPRSAADVTCRKCEEVGHFSKDCPNVSNACRNCGQDGHQAKECDQPRNPATMKCRNCDEMGHPSKECPKPC